MDQTEIQKRIERKGIVISRVPDWAKELFKVRAKEEFCDDYGMCLAAMIKECGEYHQLKKLFFEKGVFKEVLKENISTGEKPLKFGNGKQLNKPEVKKNE